MKNLFKKENKAYLIILAILFVIIGVGFRFVPHFPNFSPIAAIALFGGVYLPRKIALILPLAVLMISDLFIGTYEILLMASVYLSFLLCVLIGFWLKKHKKMVLGGAILGSISFFVITNFAVWAFTPWYVKTIPGLIQCFTMALPFFRGTLLGDLFYTTVIFGTYEMAKVFANSVYHRLQKTSSKII